VSRLTGNTAIQFIISMNCSNCAGFNFVQWPRIFLTSNLSGRQITKKNPAIFPKRLSGLCFSLRLLWKNIKTLRCHCKICRDFFTDRRSRNVSKAKQLSEQYCKLRLLKTADLNVEGNKSFSSNYFCSGKFC
jgi:hypothetical protein